MENFIQVTEKNVYGVSKLYPDNRLAMQMAMFKGQKTFTNEDIGSLKAMGFMVELYCRGTKVADL